MRFFIVASMYVVLAGMDISWRHRGEAARLAREGLRALPPGGGGILSLRHRINLTKFVWEGVTIKNTAFF